MIQANELRIGNIVGRPYYNPHPTTPSWEVDAVIIHALPEQSARIKYFGRPEITKINYDKLQPIPLTEEWLLRFGFVEFDGDMDRVIFRHNESLLMFEYKNGVCWFVFAN